MHIFAGDRFDKTCKHELQMLSFLFSQPGAPGAVSKDYGTAHAHSRPGGRLSSTTPATQDMVAPHKIQEPLIQGSPINDHRLISLGGHPRELMLAPHGASRITLSPPTSRWKPRFGRRLHSVGS